MVRDKHVVVSSSRVSNVTKVVVYIGVRDRGRQLAPPIRAVCRHTFGQRVDIIRAKHNTCLNNTNLGSVTAVNGTNSATTPPPNRTFCYYSPPTEYGSRKCLLLPPPHRIHSGKTRSAPPPNGCLPVRLWSYIYMVWNRIISTGKLFDAMYPFVIVMMR